jgi:hypothetical protein
LTLVAEQSYYSEHAMSTGDESRFKRKPRGVVSGPIIAHKSGRLRFISEQILSLQAQEADIEK